MDEVKICEARLDPKVWEATSSTQCKNYVGFRRRMLIVDSFSNISARFHDPIPFLGSRQH